MNPLIPAGVFDVLARALEERPDAPAVITRSGVLTYRQLDERADRAAGALHVLGVCPGDRVAASWPNDEAIVVAFHATMRLGAVWVGINGALAGPEKTYMLADSGASLALVGTDDAAALAGHVGCRLVDPADWDAAVAASAGRPDVPRPDPDAPAAIAYTSGTTGFPKGAVHAQAGLVLPGAATVARRRWGPDLCKGDSLPLTILNMQVLTTLLTAQAGGAAVIMDRSDVASIVEWIDRERVTVWNGPPAQLWTMIRDPSVTAERLRSLDEVWVGGADCPDELRRDFASRFGVPVTRTYGLTEAPALVALDDLGAAGPPGTSGRPLDHVGLRIRDGEITLEPRSDGEWAGVYRPALGYWNKPEESAAVIEGRRLLTGDLGALDGGHLRISGRRSTVIVRGGANVYPAEVERVLAAAPGVAACAVVGVPDERLGERVGAAVEPVAGVEPDVDELREFCLAQLAAYKVPERWIVVEQLPRNQMGKVPAPALRALLSGGARRPAG